MTKIMKCKVENILGVKDVEFSPDGRSVTIGGANGQGKTSTIWALVMALGGKDKMPIQPVREGQEKGEVTVELENMRVRLVVLEGRKSTLTVESLEGALYRTPQTMLDALFKNLAFDPGAFKTMSPAEQKRLLLQLVGVDFSDLERERSALYDERTTLTRSITQLKAKAQPVNDSLPEKEQSDAELRAELASVDAKREALSALERELDSTVRRSQEAVLVRENNANRLKGINEQMAALAKEAETLLAKDVELEKMYRQAEAECERLSGLIEATPPISSAEIAQKLQDVAQLNRRINANNFHRAEAKELAELEEKKQEKTCRLDGIEEQKADMLSKAKMPVAGLSFDENGVLFEAIPFSQISESQQWEISTAIGFALNPQGIVFMRASGGLDKTSRDRVRERAASLGVQLFLEVVDDAEDVQILIEDGGISEDRL